MANKEPALLCTITDYMQANIAIATLKDQGIPVIRKDRGIGQYSAIVLGFSFQGVEVYVPANLLNEAREIIDVVIGHENADLRENFSAVESANGGAINIGGAIESDDVIETGDAMESGDAIEAGDEQNVNETEWRKEVSHTAGLRRTKVLILLAVFWFVPFIVYLVNRFAR